MSSRTTFNSDDVAKLIESHMEWQRQGGLIGTLLTSAKELRANVIGMDFLNADFKGKNLSGAHLESCHFSNSDGAEAATFEEADLSWADLRHSYFRGVSFAGANLFNTHLEGAWLDDVDLSTTRGLLARNLAAADLSGAKLPTGLEKFELLGTLDKQVEASKSLWMSLVAAGVYICLTLADSQSALELSLPFLGTKMNSQLFYPMACFVLLVLYSYFQIYLQRLWELVIRLPARFPDGTALDQKLSWITGAFIRQHFSRIMLLERRAFDRFERIIAVGSTYWVVPLATSVVATIYAWRTDLRAFIPGWHYLNSARPQQHGSVIVLAVHVLLTLATAAIAIAFYFRMKKTLHEHW